MIFNNKFYFLCFLIIFISCNNKKITLEHGIDASAGGVPTYIITTPNATYYLEKNGGGLSSLLDKDQIDWIAFHNRKGSGRKGEYRGFPNAIHRQDGSYFHAMNAGTNPSSSIVDIKSENHIRITFSSDNNQWKGRWDFYPSHCDFTMTKVSPGYHYWIQYEGVPGGEMDNSDFWYASLDNRAHSITETFTGDLPYPEWMAFGDINSSRMLYLLHHEDDKLPDNYLSRTEMTVLGFGRKNAIKTTKHLNTPQTFSIGFIESTDYIKVEETIKKILP